MRRLAFWKGYFAVNILYEPLKTNFIFSFHLCIKTSLYKDLICFRSKNVRHYAFRQIKPEYQIRFPDGRFLRHQKRFHLKWTLCRQSLKSNRKRARFTHTKKLRRCKPDQAYCHNWIIRWIHPGSITHYLCKGCKEEGRRKGEYLGYLHDTGSNPVSVEQTLRVSSDDLK